MSAGSARKTPFVKSIGNFATRRIMDAIQLTGKALPCHVTKVEGAIVTVSFDVQSSFTLPQIAVPIFGSIYARAPTQVGDKGVVFPCDTRIGHISGLGTGTPDLTPPGNLSALVFFPIGNAQWAAPVDPNAYVLTGPNGVVLGNSTMTCVITLTPDGITITLPNDGKIQVNNGDVVAGDISLKHHVHSAVQTGSDESGEPVG